MIRILLIAILMTGLLSSLERTSSYAEAKYTIKTMTKEVETALNNRRDRFQKLEALEKEGAVGENNRGYVAALTATSDVETIVGDENKDRQVIYKTIAEQNNLEGAIETIEKIFAQVQREKANAGDKIQSEDGSWISK